MRADRLALISAADRPRRALVGRNAEVVRPEPDQPFGEADMGIERSIVARLGFGEINLLRQRRPGLCRRHGSCVKTMSFLAALSPAIVMSFAPGEATRGSFMFRCAMRAALRSWRNSNTARRALSLLMRPELLIRPAPDARSETRAPRGSDAMAAMSPGRGPKPNRCSANAACAEGSFNCGSTVTAGSLELTRALPIRLRQSHVDTKAGCHCA